MHERTDALFPSVRLTFCVKETIAEKKRERVEG